MRKPLASVHQLLIAVLALVLTFGAASVASADDRADARQHYQAGQRMYAAADYKGAIREFGAAQQLLPADLNSYNLALCYDKLGDAEPAMQYYREYLGKVPNTDKRSEIEASISRLDAAAKSAASKRAEEDRRADEQRRADDARRLEEQRRVDDQRRLDDQRRADEQRRLDDARRQPPQNENPGVGPTTGPIGPGTGAVGGVTGAAAPTGDPQLDRVQAIDINQIRDQRAGGAGAMDTRNGAGGPPVAGGPNGPVGPNGAQPGPNGVQPAAMPGAPTDKPVETPVYKKWWFWAVVGVSLYVVYEIANSNNSNSTQTFARQTPANRGAAPQAPQGLTLLRW